MHRDRVDIGEEVGAKKAFVWVIDWPGWCRGGKDAGLAIEALLEHGPRYARVATAAGLEAPTDASAHDLYTVESVGGGAGTDFGVPSTITDLDRRSLDRAEAERRASLVGAAWTVLDEIAVAAPASLRKGPRGGGRDRDKMLGHVFEADDAYARQLGIRLAAGTLDDRAAVATQRAAVLEMLRQPSDGSPVAERRWTSRYAARRIAWHALDHAWEMEDRSEPAP
jgi:hypothetical protein